MAELYGVPGPWEGRLAIAGRPRGGDWLQDELATLRAAGVDVLVSLLTPAEVHEFSLDREAEFAASKHIESVSFPIDDRGVPSAAAMLQLVRQIQDALLQGKTVALHCRAGVGRSALVAAAVLAAAGSDTEEAFEQISRSHGLPVPDTQEQRDWLARLAQEGLRPARKAAS
jgi:protein-tyrosine phosphatase